MCEPYNNDKSLRYRVDGIITRVIFCHYKFGANMRTL